MLFLFFYLGAYKLDHCAVKPACGTIGAVRVALFHEQYDFVESFFRNDGLSRSNLQAKDKSRPVWYEIRNVKYRHETALVLINTKDA